MGQTGGKKVSVILGFFGGFAIAAVLALFTASQVKSTSTAEFCVSCHEMRTFYETWRAGVHGPDNKGVIKAECVDCHLPHDGVVEYPKVKVQSGLHDMMAHKSGKKPNWLEKMEARGPHEHMAYESGCLRCHKELVAKGIPIKAFTAHRAYELGESINHCVDCHKGAGHGDIVTAILEKRDL